MICLLLREMPFTPNRFSAIKTSALGTGEQILAHPMMECHKKSEAVLSGLVWGGLQDLLLRKRKKTKQVLLQFGERGTEGRGGVRLMCVLKFL